MATYNTAFGALPSYKDLIGQQPGQYMQQQPQQLQFDSDGGRPQNQQFPVQQQQQQQQQQPQQTFAQMQQQGMARPAPPPPQPDQYTSYGGSQQAAQTREALLAQIQQQLAQPTRFDTDMFNQIRQSQAANLQSEFQGQQQFLNEEMARRGISASSIASGRFGDLLGQQARALSDLDSRLLQFAAETQAQDRLASLRGGMDFAELASSQDLSEFEANRVGQAQRFQEELQSARFGEEMRQFDVQQALAELLGVGGLGLQTEQVRGDLNLRARQLQQDAFAQGRSLDLQEARDMAQREQFNLSMATQKEQFQQEIEFRSRQLQQEAALQGRSLDLQQARDIAQREQFDKNLSAQREQFYATLGQNESQFARTMDEQRELRLQNLGISMSQLEQEALRIQQGDRSLSLQEARDEAEVKYRLERLQQDANQFGEQLSYQKARDEAEFELSYAKLAEETAYRMQQFGISQQQLSLEARKIENQADQFNKQLSAEQIFRTAEINLRTQQIMMEYERSGQQIDLAYARIQAEKDIEGARLTFSREELAQRQGQFDRTMQETVLERELRERLGMRGLDIQEMMADRNWLLELLKLLGQGGGGETGTTNPPISNPPGGDPPPPPIGDPEPPGPIDGPDGPKPRDLPEDEEDDPYVPEIPDVFDKPTPPPEDDGPPPDDRDPPKEDGPPDPKDRDEEKNQPKPEVPEGPATWGNTDPETGKAWEEGRILTDATGRPWIRRGGLWEIYDPRQEQRER